ncbi:S-adenosyl-L-methionine-dependent methyltransferase superfamily protein [Rhynchospora pubera]|uniref:S-adenosyl-L-methionine-dependent methyltransferase superfamily protein n=1 Tax=Rhynchospora pubera TaxID=906938 RepID=A0AAV8CJL4_9POAL|nr:S-adenosyl-L-methionine-dependent methyltransferase superfamily protein [Rhynchospora pubera]
MLERNLHMLGGTGESSYAANSTLQKRYAAGAMFLVKEAMESLVHVMIPTSETLLVFADLGCSTGANAFVTHSSIMGTISKTCKKLDRPMPEIQLLLNDLPGNDFNTLLGPALSSYKERISEAMREIGVSFYTAAVSGSFYTKLFPKRSVHFIYSCASLHWLSQVPFGLSNATDGTVINRRSLWISNKSPPIVSRLYLEQFQRDFSLFLKHRCEELHSEGRMTLIIPGRVGANALTEESAPWISWYEDGLQDLVSVGIVKAADVNSFNVPFYYPSMAEVKSIIHTEGSFEIINDHAYEILYTNCLDVIPADTDKIWEKIINISRAVLEPLLVSHFGDSIIQPLFFSTLPKMYAKESFKEKYKLASQANLAISLKKK